MISNSIGLEWLKRIFIPNSTPQQGQHRLPNLDGHGSHVSVEFIWTCRQNNIRLLYLPPYSSHILQSLDLATFSVVKSWYWNRISDLSVLDNVVPIKKERFISVYYHAKEKGMIERAIRAGWRASGPYPYNPELVLKSLQVTGRPRAPSNSQEFSGNSNQVCGTPWSSYDLYIAAQKLLLTGTLSWNTRALLSKESKAITKGNTREVQLTIKLH